MSLETNETREIQATSISDVPSAHLEGLDKAKLEKMDPQAAAFEVGKNYFNEDVQTSAGVLEAYKELDKDGNAEKFAKSYSDYINMPGIMKIRDPKMYEFMRDRVFYGKEYKYETKSNAFNMTFPYSPAEGRELRKTAMENKGISPKQPESILSNKMNFMPEAAEGVRGRQRKINNKLY